MSGYYYRDMSDKPKDSAMKVQYLLCEGLKYFGWNAGVNVRKVNAMIGDPMKALF